MLVPVPVAQAVSRPVARLSRATRRIIETRSPVLHRLLGVKGLVFGGVGGGDGRTIDGIDAVAAPEVLGGGGGLGLAHQPIVDLRQALQRQAAARLAVRAILVRG